MTAKLRNDCFALPPGVNWIPLEDALARLRDRVTPVVGEDLVPLNAIRGRILSQDIVALRANPPAPNSAVDGYGFAGAALDELVTLPLADGRSAAGDPYGGVLPAGHALRILTGAIVPEGMETVVLQEDVEIAGGKIQFRGPLKQGANLRRAGEDFSAGDVVLRKGRRLRPEDAALLAAAGLAEVPVYRPLRVGVFSNGDEVVMPGTIAPEDMGAGKIYDSNRPMLLSLLSDWGFHAVDLGHVRDSRAALRDRLTSAVAEVDAVLTSGGVSTGDEDHVSALLRDEGQIDSWRIAIKPGRPLALGLWPAAEALLPVFGLPGNPVAAFVTALLFARPALGVMAGQAWREPQGFMVPAAFAKSKKPGRREFLRARLNTDGQAEVFKSEGSGRISGLSWADGLVELPHEAAEITTGTPVRFLPYSCFN
ncbi:molybdopterin-binding protein [Thalassobius sp. Cn5-15]|uniref:molybdopterin-binding protein n=1 Tax=Thalassobius sp. Cn5-15 TaxID=2917763 RepID=UPI001EF27572|nr:molybdopterin-binding protein [Thalassobius sp. Cn5-15]MCG7494266.1 molybdopterin-binding protein [Thalassobius sp. Cn5-15]